MSDKRDATELFRNLRLVEVRKAEYTDASFSTDEQIYELHFENTLDEDVLGIVVEVGVQVLKDYNLPGWNGDLEDPSVQ